MKSEYVEVEMDVIEFTNVDVIADSCVPMDDPDEFSPVGDVG